MLRSLFAVIVAVIAGMAVAKFIEGGGRALIGEGAGAAYQTLLAASWFVGAFVAALIALLIGRKWAPLGALAAGTIFFSAFMSLMSAHLSWLLWPGAAAATGLGGFLALRLLNTTKDYPTPKAKEGLFDD